MNGTQEIPRQPGPTRRQRRAYYRCAANPMNGADTMDQPQVKTSHSRWPACKLQRQHSTISRRRGSVMDKLSLVHRIMLGRTFTIAMVLVNLVVIVPITVTELHDWFLHWGNLSKAAEGEDLLLAFPGQGPIGVILVALGVVLEGRHTFLRKVLKLYGLDHLPGQETLCDLCELFGFYLLLVGLVVECLSEFVKFIGVNNHGVLLTFGAASLLLNTIAVLLLLQLSYLVARVQLVESSTAPQSGKQHS